jgi:2-C-methyl-D-erythritol 4-phosphate cytidylyltransferase / 2-C-methyl-D-erythritol 2,4-cyclodiphosphate synthase
MLTEIAQAVKAESTSPLIAHFLCNICLLSGLENAISHTYDGPMEHKPPSACAIIVAGGIGSRAMGDSSQDTLPKQFQTLGGKPVLKWSLDAFACDNRFTQIIVVCAAQFRDRVLMLTAPNKVIFADAGATRTASVQAGLAEIATPHPDLVFIHDAARPGLTEDVLDALFTALENGADGAAPTRQVADALWHSNGGVLTSSQDCNNLLRVQTPQAFRTAKLLAAYTSLGLEGERADDIAVAREAGLNIVAIDGSQRLDKITWPQDFARMDMILAPPLLPRVATGMDAHRFVEGDKVTLCGVEIPHTARLAGHSDADVGWHALADAIYGALCAGDIGHHFPPSEPRWKGAASSVFLKHAGDMVRGSGGAINHVDVTLICEAPRIGPHRAAMADATAQVLGLRPDQVSIKATTTEGMGFTGRREGIAAQASATILLPQDFRQAAEVAR